MEQPPEWWMIFEDELERRAFLKKAGLWVGGLLIGGSLAALAGCGGKNAARPVVFPRASSPAQPPASAGAGVDIAVAEKGAAGDLARRAVEALGGMSRFVQPGHTVVVKPNDQGSTVGLSLVREAKDLARAFAEAVRFSKGVLVESYVPGRELTVGVLGDEALPVVEIFPEGGLYDYRCKYTAGMSRYECPAQLETGLASRIRELGRRAFQVLGCRGVARVDFRLDPEGRPYCLEVNTVPGMTPTSLVPMAAKARGLSYDDVVARMLELGLEAAAGQRGGAVRH